MPIGSSTMNPPSLPTPASIADLRSLLEFFSDRNRFAELADQVAKWQAQQKEGVAELREAIDIQVKREHELKAQAAVIDRAKAELEAGQSLLKKQVGAATEQERELNRGRAALDAATQIFAIEQRDGRAAIDRERNELKHAQAEAAAAIRAADAARVEYETKLAKLRAIAE